jgi:adenylylsulfate kinase
MKNNGVVIWMTGLSGAGKSTIANHLQQLLLERSLNVEILDGDLMRQQLSPNLGYTQADRDLHIRRISFMADLLGRNGVITIVSVISPYRAIRQEVRSLMSCKFVEVYVDCPLEVCERRDVKGLYRSARAGLIQNFTGIDAPYERPLDPEITCHTDRESIAESALKILTVLAARGWIEPIVTENRLQPIGH